MMTCDLGRRRSARLEFHATPEVLLRTWTSVRVVDISATGVLLETKATETWDRIELLMPLGGVTFAAKVQVRRRQLLRDGRGEPCVRIGGSFLNLDDASRGQLAEFLAGGARPANGGHPLS
jgi:hypothetical protein